MNFVKETINGVVYEYIKADEHLKYLVDCSESVCYFVRPNDPELYILKSDYVHLKGELLNG